MNEDIIKPAEMGYVGEDADGNFVKVSRRDWLQFLKLMRHVRRAEQLHPAFAEGIYQGLGRIGEEYGELVRACNHEEGEKRIMEEAMDTLAVAWRFVRGDWGED